MCLDETVIRIVPDDGRHGWDHPQCVRCWLRDFGLTRIPSRVKGAPDEGCCFCGARTTNSVGIYRLVRPGSRSIPYCADFPGFIYNDDSSRPRT